MAFSTRAFDLYYKRMGPTGSNAGAKAYTGYIVENWYTSSSNSPVVSASYLNFPKDTISNIYLTTRNVNSNARFAILPWGSAACDFLWNVTVPSWSYYQSQSTETRYGSSGTTDVIYRIWTVDTHQSRSFFKDNVSSFNGFGVSTYPITSSWRILDRKLISGSNNIPASFKYVHEDNNSLAYPVFIGSEQSYIATDTSLQYGYEAKWPTLSSTSTGSFSKQYFDDDGGAAITRAAISASLVTASISGSSNTATALRHMTQALKARRLFFPIPVSGSGTTGGTDYVFGYLTGYKASDLFQDNGGIYNVQFTLKRSLEIDTYPDEGTYMSVFIHNVLPQIPSASARVPGADGWYPPDTNIIKVGNGYQATPIMTFSDANTGYLVERFSITVVQYGYPAQLCFEVSGSLADNKYFGIIVDDVQVCQTGVTTDPRFIKPLTIEERTNIVAGKYGTVSAPAPPPID